MFRPPSIAATAAVLATVVSFPRAQDGPGAEEGRTVVVARKWEDLLEDLPTSATVVSGAEIEQAGWTTIRDVSDSIPNVRITEFSSRRLSFPFVRGIGSGQGDPAVITYIDGVPQFGSGGLNLPLLDVGRVEFLRGPQGSLYGRNALGGLIHVITERPSPTPSLFARTTLGSFHLQEYAAGYSGPALGDGPLVSASLLYSMRDGFTKNLFTGNDVDDRDALFGRGQILLTPNSDGEVRITLFGERSRDGGFVLNDINALKSSPHRINQDFEGVAERDVLSPTVTWSHYGAGVDFVSITSYQDWDVLETTDFDFTPIDGVRRRTEESQSYLYQEVRLSSAEGSSVRLGGGKTMRWLAGISGFISDAERSAANDFRPGGEGVFFPPGGVGLDTSRGDFDDYGLGVFGQVTVTLEETVDVSAGLRIDHESKDVDVRRTFEVGGFPVLDVASSFDEDFDEVLPQFSVAYHATGDVTTYATAARGFKAGGFNLSAPAGSDTFDPERSWTYEVGLKASTMEDRVDVGVALFYVDWDDMQLSQFDAMAGGFVTNAGESTSMGLEIEIDLQATEELTLFASGGYTDTEFDRFVDLFGVDVSGNALPFAPEATLNVGGQYVAEVGEDMELFARANLTWVGEFFYDPGNVEDESFVLTDFRAGVRSGSWSLDVSLRNAFDEEYIPVAFQPSPIDPTIFVGESGPPRILLVSLGVRP